MACNIFLYPRYETFSLTLLNFPLNEQVFQEITLSDLTKFMLYLEDQCQSKNFLSLDIWQKFALLELNIDFQLAKVYFELYICLFQDYNSANISLEYKSHLDESDTAVINSSYIYEPLKFIIFLYLQTTTFHFKQFNPNEKWPDSISQKDQYSYFEENLFINLLSSLLHNILSLISKYYHISNELEIPLYCLSALDIIFLTNYAKEIVLSIETVIKQNKQDNFIGYIPSRNTLSIILFEKWILAHLVINPNGITSIINGKRDRENFFLRSSYRGRASSNYTISKEGSRITLLDNIQKQIVILKPHNALITHASIRNCKDSSIYILTPHETVNIYNCYNCEIVISPIRVCISLRKCKNLTLQCITRKIILHCLFHCKLYINSTTMPLFLFGNYDISLAPFNVLYPAFNYCFNKISNLDSKYNLWNKPIILNKSSIVSCSIYNTINESNLTLCITPLSTLHDLSYATYLQIEFLNYVNSNISKFNEFSFVKQSMEEIQLQTLQSAIKDMFNSWLIDENCVEKIHYMFSICHH